MTSVPQVQEDPLALYKERRENAIAFWATIPVDQVHMYCYNFCALGHLAKANFDGWRMRGEVPFHGDNYMSPLRCAQRYFGLEDYFGDFMARIAGSLFGISSDFSTLPQRLMKAAYSETPEKKVDTEF